MANTFNLGNGNWASKKEAVLAYNSENSNFKPLPFTFDRASTATVVNKQGLIETVGTDEPRIDFLNNSKGHLLLEPSRSNRLSYSEDFSSWGTSGTVNLTSGIVSPKGDNSAYTVSGTGDLTMPTSLASTGTHIFSIYAKGNIGDTFRVFKSNGFSYSQDTITIDSTDWKRYQFSRDFTSTSGIIFIDNFDEGTISLWGAQLEEGSYATSYIPTQGETNGVTRSVETCSGAGNSNVFNDSEGVLYAEFASLTEGGTSRRISISDGDTSDRIVIENDEQSGRYRFFISGGGTTIELTNKTGVTEKNYNKIAVSWNGANSKVYFNGEKTIPENTDTPTISGLSVLQLQNSQATGSNLEGKVKDVRVYNTALTDAELIQLTT